jgi:sec-independent protein translocase protein TatB
MFGIGTGELLLLLVIALLVLGPERMPKLARDLGKTMADLRKTSDELRTEFLNADKALNAERILDVATRASAAPAETAKAAEMSAVVGAPEAQAPSAPPDVGATQAEAATGPDVAPPSDVPPVEREPDETEFDREARLARERIEDPEQMKEHEARAKAEGWTVPTDEAGTSPREG